MNAISRARQLGLSLVEVLVAVAIGMIGILIITQAYLTGDNFQRATLGEGGAQVNGMIALYTLEREARMSGYGFNDSSSLGCGKLHWFVSGVGYSTEAGGTMRDVTLAPVVITADTVTPANPDTLEILYSTEGERSMATSISNYSTAGSFVSIGTEAFKVGDMLVLVKAGDCALLKVTTLDAGAAQLRFETSSPNNPANLAGLPVYASNDTAINLGTPAHRIYRVDSGKLQLADSLLSTGALSYVDLVEGIVDLRALYGKDTNNDNIVDRYDLTTPTTAAEWAQVQAVKVGLLARVGNYERAAGGGDCIATTAVPAWSGSAVAGSVFVANPFQAVSIAAGSQDRCYRYRVFETTVPLRNMIWKPS